MTGVRSWEYLLYGDDIVTLGLIENNKEEEYQDTILCVTSCCNESCLDLTVGKPKGMIFDFRKIQDNKLPIRIYNISLGQVPSCKYLGAIIQNYIKWNEHVTT